MSSTKMSTSSVSIKARFEDGTVRRFTCGSTWEEVAENLGKPFRVFYVDDEGDRVLITEEKEFVECVRIVGEPVRLEVEQKKASEDMQEKASEEDMEKEDMEKKAAAVAERKAACQARKAALVAERKAAQEARQAAQEARKAAAEAAKEERLAEKRQQKKKAAAETKKAPEETSTDEDAVVVEAVELRQCKAAQEARKAAAVAERKAACQARKAALMAEKEARQAAKAAERAAKQAAKEERLAEKRQQKKTAAAEAKKAPEETSTDDEEPLLEAVELRQEGTAEVEPGLAAHLQRLVPKILGEPPFASYLSPAITTDCRGFIDVNIQKMEQQLSAESAKQWALGRAEDAETLLCQALSLSPGNADGWYKLACQRAESSRVTGALESLEEAVRVGYSDVERLAVEPALRGLQGIPLFERLRSLAAKNTESTEEEAGAASSSSSSEETSEEDEEETPAAAETESEAEDETPYGEGLAVLKELLGTSYPVGALAAALLEAQGDVERALNGLLATPRA